MRWNEHMVESNGVMLHYFRTLRPGGDPPTLVLAHGVTDNALCWSSVVEALEADYDIVLYDARGHGLSDAPAEDYTWEAFADDLAGLIEALALDRPVLVGHSMGAHTAAMVAARHPELVGALVLEDPPWWESRPPSHPKRETAEWRTQIEQEKQQSRESLIRQARADHPTWSLQDIEFWADAKRQVDPRVASLLASKPPSWEALLPSISAPALLATGDHELGAIVTPELATLARELAPDLQVVHLPGAGHSVRNDQFAPFLTALRAFLEER